jgi:hypothetical protein
MNSKNLILLIIIVLWPGFLTAQKADPFKPDFSSPAQIKGMTLVWNDEFNNDDNPDKI